MKTISIRPPVKYPGGKFYVAKEILRYAPNVNSYNTYVEVFGGMASFLLQKERSPVEVYNDVNERLCRFWRVIRDNHEELQRLLQLSPYNENEFAECLSDANCKNEVELARRDYVRWRQSFGGTGKTFSSTTHRVRGGFADVVNSWLTSIDENLPAVAERFRGVQGIYSADFAYCITRWDSPDTLFYFDPPYVPTSRATKAVYENEMDEPAHVRLLEMLPKIKGKFILSGYGNPLYDSSLSMYRKVEFDFANHAAGGEEKRRMVETIWLNF